VSVHHRPIAAIGLAHDAGTGRAAFEAFVAVRAPWSEPRASFLGKEPGTLEGVCGRPFDSIVLAGAVIDAYAAAAGGRRALADRAVTIDAPSSSALRSEPAWTSRIEEAIGWVCAGPDAGGMLRLGGELMASRDAVAKIESDVAALGASATREDLGKVVNEAFGAGTVIEGVKELGNVRDALWNALG
jgi:hypothetical protein